MASTVDKTLVSPCTRILQRSDDGQNPAAATASTTAVCIWSLSMPVYVIANSSVPLNDIVERRGEHRLPQSRVYVHEHGIYSREHDYSRYINHFLQIKSKESTEASNLTRNCLSSVYRGTRRSQGGFSIQLDLYVYLSIHVFLLLPSFLPLTLDLLPALCPIMLLLLLLLM